MQHPSLILNNNNMKSQISTHFPGGGVGLGGNFKTFWFPSWCNILVTFPKRSVVSNVNPATIFTQHFVQNCSQLVILGHVHTHDWYVNKDSGRPAWYVLSLCSVISKSNCSVVDNLLHNPSGVQIPTETIFISISCNMNPLSSKKNQFTTKSIQKRTKYKIFSRPSTQNLWIALRFPTFVHLLILTMYDPRRQIFLTIDISPP